MARDLDDVDRIHKSFVKQVKRLPDSREGILTLIADSFWELVTFRKASRKDDEHPARWADGQVSRWVTELGLSFVEEHGSELKNFQHLRILLLEQAELFGPKPSEVFNGEARKPLLLRLEEAKLNRPKVRQLIWKDFNSLVLEVFQARIAVLVKGTDTETTVRRKFAEIALLTSAEFDRLLQPTEDSEREMGAARQIAAELAGGRCGLGVGSVKEYAEPGSQGQTERNRSE